MVTRLDQFDASGDGEPAPEEENEEEVQLKRGSGEGQEGQDGGGGEEEILKKRARTRKLGVEHLAGEFGLKRMYEEFPHPFSSNMHGNEASALALLVSSVRTWGDRMFPGLALTDLLGGVEALGTKGVTRSLVDDLRDRERNRYMRDVLGIVDSGVSREQVQLQSPVVQPPVVQPPIAETHIDEPPIVEPHGEESEFQSDDVVHSYAGEEEETQQPQQQEDEGDEEERLLNNKRAHSQLASDNARLSKTYGGTNRNAENETEEVQAMDNSEEEAEFE